MHYRLSITAYFYWQIAFALFFLTLKVGHMTLVAHSAVGLSPPQHLVDDMISSCFTVVSKGCHYKLLLRFAALKMFSS